MRSLVVLLLLCVPAQALEIRGKDQYGFEFNLADKEGLAVVTFFNAGCPLGKFYANRLNELHEKYPDVSFVAVNYNDGDTYEDMVEFGSRLKFPIVKDDGTIAGQLNPERSPQTFLLNHGQVIYSGRIDDQYEPGIHSRTAPKRRDLEEAIKEVLDGREISVPVTEATGCRIQKPKKPAAPTVTYSHVAPIFHRKCAECHRPGQSAPFSLLTYEDAAGWSDTIRDVITEKRMPPWGADPRYGHFANDRSLTADERTMLLAWLEAGSPPGEAPPPPTYASDWSIRPDIILTAPEFTVPAEGLLDYQNFIIDPGLTKDTWVEAVEVKPGNRAVVHHAFVSVQPKDAQPGMTYSRDGDQFLSAYVPGNSSMKLPAGYAKCIPAGWNLRLTVHYTSNGEIQRDQTQIGLRIARQRPTHEVANKLLIITDFELQPGEVRTLVKEDTLEQDQILLALGTHMHLRGRSMLFEAIYPDLTTEILLNVPDYDFAWQHQYVLAEPKALPKGTVLRCTAVFDNSANNKRNPDPTVVVRQGERTEDEMFNAGFQFAQPIKKQSFMLPLVGVVIGLLFLMRRFK